MRLKSERTGINLKGCPCLIPDPKDVRIYASIDDTSKAPLMESLQPS